MLDFSTTKHIFLRNSIQLYTFFVIENFHAAVKVIVLLQKNCIEGVETLSNRQPDTDWVVISHINLDGYLGYDTFSKKLLATIPEDILIRSKNHAVNRYNYAGIFVINETSGTEISYVFSIPLFFVSTVSFFGLYEQNRNIIILVLLYQ